MLVYAVESETEGVEPGWYSPLCYGELIYDRVMNNNSAASAVKVNGILERKIQLITVLLTHSFSYSLTYSLTHSLLLTHSLTHSKGCLLYTSDAADE